jgi:hypothetical protein
VISQLFVLARQFQTWRYAACFALVFVARGFAAIDGPGAFLGILLAWLCWTALLTPAVAFVRYARRSS